ncbi:MAG: hypothetical protein A3E82_02670 [Gammaproteobacteria bacterium RIFCSPHIGHO2_12_FULL_38_11]|nr:MAG: hypothetical protein A3E82_02670 [Gammaproteobacteria bacterium RIFCSPHIGHO2_12_FULL_38_11]
MQKNHLKTNIVIAGAGLVGISFALCMQPKNCTITILETHLPNILTQTKTDSRPISLSYGSHMILKQLGIWDELAQCACPILSVHVSEMGKLGVTQFYAAEQQVSALGFVVPFEKLQLALYQKLFSQKNIQLISIQSIDAINYDHACTDIAIKTSEGEKKLSTELLIASDGSNSTCRALLNIKTIEKNCGDQAMIYHLDLSEEHGATAYERFTQFGVLAILPLFNKKKAQLVWTISHRQMIQINSWDDNKILLFLQNAFEGRLSITHIKKNNMLPLQTSIAETQIKPGAVLLGNAAHTIYPVAAQGFNLGLRDALTLSKILNHSEKLNDFSLLQEYEKTVRDYQEVIYKITNRLIGFFELNLPCFGHFRGLGLLGLDLISPLKNQLARRAMGI